MIKGAPKHPDSQKWYSLTWSEAELKEGTIQQATWGESIPPGISIDQEKTVERTNAVLVSGGALGTFYDLPLQIQTDTGETLHSGLRFKIDNKGH